MEILQHIFTPLGVTFSLLGISILMISWWLVSRYYQKSCSEMEFLTEKKQKQYHDEFLIKIGIVAQKENSNIIGKGLMIILMVGIMWYGTKKYQFRNILV